MACVQTVSYSVLINEQPYDNIIPSRGIRQGDLLSPYFFILCAEGFSSLLHKVECDRRITGLPIVIGGMRFNHLFFADDSLFFYKANIPEWLNIQDILAIYEQASGQKLNREKTSIFFSRNTKAATKQHILSVVGVYSTTHFEKYLGLLALIGGLKVEAFSGLQGKIWGLINSWKESFSHKQVKTCS
jgi:hypothetical protein